MSHERQVVIAVNTLSVPGPRLGGGYTYLRNLLPELIRAAPAARFALLVARSTRRLFMYDTDHVQLTTLADTALRASHRTIIERYLISRWLRSVHADLYFVPYGWLPRHPPCPTVWTFQNLLLLDKYQDQLTPPRGLHRRMRERLRGELLRKVLLPPTLNADRIIAVSHSAFDDLVAQHPPCRERMSVVHEGVNPHFSPAGNDMVDAAVLSRLVVPAPYYLSVSTLMRHKRHESLIKAFARFKSESTTEARLVIAGDDWGGYRRRLEHLVQQLGAGEFIRFLGRVNPLDLPALYRNARSFVLLSTCESFGLPALEAMACGCPTVVADVGGLAEVVGDGGVRIDPHDLAGISDVLHQLDNSPARRTALSRAGLMRAGHFCWRTAAEKTMTIFENLLELHGKDDSASRHDRTGIPATPSPATSCPAEINPQPDDRIAAGIA